MAFSPSFLDKPGKSIDGYDRSRTASEQRDVPTLFKHAMRIREAVFVNEQHVPLENELDEDDKGSFHWVIYANKPSDEPRVPADPETGLPPLPPGRRKSSSVASGTRVPIGTIRLVPPPHPPHAHPGTEHAIDNKEAKAPVSPQADAANDGPTSTNNPHNEPYIKIGRLAVLKDFRRMGIARQLMEAALEWAAHHPGRMGNGKKPSENEAARYADGIVRPPIPEWKGLVLVHAQKEQEGLYKGWHFVTDEAMGTWVEEGIDHVGMWKRIQIFKEPYQSEEGSRWSSTNA